MRNILAAAALVSLTACAGPAYYGSYGSSGGGYYQGQGSGAMYPTSPTYGNSPQTVYQSELDYETYHNQAAIGRDYNRWDRDASYTDYYRERSQLDLARRQSRDQAQYYRDMMSIPRSVTHGAYDSMRYLHGMRDLLRDW